MLTCLLFDCSLTKITDLAVRFKSDIGVRCLDRTNQHPLDWIGDWRVKVSCEESQNICLTWMWCEIRHEYMWKHSNLLSGVNFKTEIESNWLADATEACWMLVWGLTSCFCHLPSEYLQNTLLIGTCGLIEAFPRETAAAAAKEQTRTLSSCFFWSNYYVSCVFDYCDVNQRFSQTIPGSKNLNLCCSLHQLYFVFTFICSNLIVLIRLQERAARWGSEQQV